MIGEQIIGLITSLICCWGCGVLFLSLGLHADRSKKPVNFWAGKEVDSRRITDIAAYNHENAVMWKVYAIPYWVSGLFLSLDCVDQIFSILGTLVLLLSCLPGLPILIRHYCKIETKYVNSKRLDKIDPIC